MAAETKGRDECLSSCFRDAIELFKERIDKNISSRDLISVYAPGRVNLIGEHTDYNNGCVFPMALPQVTVMVGRASTTGSCRLITDAPVEGDTDVVFPVPHPPSREQLVNNKGRIELATPKWCSYVIGVVSVLNGDKSHSPLGVPPFEAVVTTSVPIGGGVSSSAALEVATLMFIEELCCRSNITLISRTLPEKALVCQSAEHIFANAPCGIMDQFVSVMAHNSCALFIDCQPDPDGTYKCKNVPLPLEENDLVILVVNTRVKHEVGGGEYAKRRDRCYDVAHELGKNSLRDVNTVQELESVKDKMSGPVPDGPTRYQCALHAVTETNRTIEAVEVLEKHDFIKFGQLMNESHASLRDVYCVSCDELDTLVAIAQAHEGVYGSRMTGAGFGGCTVSLVKKSCVGDLVNKIVRKYQDRHKITPDYYIVTPCSGAAVVGD